MSRPASSSRLLTLLAIAHASLAFYLWFCAFELSLPSTSLRLWEILGALWPIWPALLVDSAARLLGRHAGRHEHRAGHPVQRGADLALMRRSGIQFLTNSGSSRARLARFSRYGRTSPCTYTKEVQ